MRQLSDFLYVISDGAGTIFGVMKMSWLYWLVLAFALLFIGTPLLAHFSVDVTFTLWWFGGVLLGAVIIWSILAGIARRRLTAEIPGGGG